MKRMDDETAAHLMTALETDTDDERDIARDWRRARERERRLEEALREFEGAFTDLDPDNQATRNRMRRALIQARAALSPSPASLARFFGVPPEALVPHEGPVTYEPKTTLPEPASGVVGGKACARCVECGHLREEHEYGYGACQHGSCDHCTYFHEPPTPAPGKDGGR